MLPPITLTEAAAALAVNAVLAVAAWRVRAVTPSGALAGALCGTIVYGAGGWRLFSVIACVFLLTTASTRAGYRRKQRLALAESPNGRSARQILSNLSVAAGCAAAWMLFGRTEWLLACVAALAEAAADTVASEIGQLAPGRPIMITTLQRVPPGTDGGISLLGTVAGFVAAGLVALFAATVGVTQLSSAPALALVGGVGMLADSVFGATLQRRGALSNDGVNLLGTLVSAGLMLAASAVAISK